MKKAQDIETDVADFLAAGGKIMGCDSSHNAGAQAHLPKSRRQMIALQKRIGGDVVNKAIARRKRKA